MKVLLAVDGSECSEAAVNAVATRFDPRTTEIRVLHAVEWLREMPFSFSYGRGASSIEDVLASRERSFTHAGELVERIAGELKAAGFRVSVSTPDADPRHEIVNAATEWPADLIVIGSHGRRGVDRMLMGSVAESVVRHAPCSVDVERVPRTKVSAPAA